MPFLTLKISLDNGAIVKTVKFDTSTKVHEAHRIVEEKILDGASGDNYGLFLTSTDDQKAGIWLEPDKTLEYYMLRDGDTLLYLNRIRNLRVRMLDGTVKTIEVDESIPVSSLMLFICLKIGIANYDEYGLCREEKEETEEMKTNTGTLTLKRKPQEKERERDAKMEHLRKKLKTDDEVQWLDSTKSLRELSVEPGETVLLKRRLFYTDRNVDSRDPIQLNLLYVQARDAILRGTHPIAEKMACEFAGIQCQIQFGDYKEDKHTPDIIEPKEFLPIEYSKSRGIKKKILQEHAKHAGINELEAKTLYVRTARSLPTYGVTFFLVKEKQKGKNRLVPRLLGINAESIQRLDENTKETLVIWPLTHVQRWKANDTTFTLDFGEYSDKQYACQTSEARRIENVLKSYIDIILKKKKAKDYFGKYGSESEPMAIDVVGASKATIIQHTYHNAQTLKEESYIGPSRIISAEEGTQITTGNQIMTVQRMIVTEQKASGQQFAHNAYQATAHSDVLKELKWKQRLLPKLLTGVNTRAVTIVGLATESGQIDEGELKNQVKILNEDLPDIDAGVKKLCEGNKLDEKEKSDLLKQLEDLHERIEALTALTGDNPVQNAQEIADVASKVSDISTKMLNSVDPAAKRRSKLLMSSRMSFIEEDLAESEREKRSLLLTLGKARENLLRLLNNLHDNTGALSVPDQDLTNRQRKLAKDLALLNAATASLLASHSDPKDIDYAGAKTATDTIMEVIPKIEKDAKIIANIISNGNLDDTTVKEDLRRLLDSVTNILEHVGSQDSEKLNDAAITLGNMTKLFYDLCHPYVESEKKNEIIALTKHVDDKTSELLLKTNELAIASGQGIPSDVDTAGGRCVDASRRLVTCAQLAAPFIYNPRCQSAMLSSTNAVASSVEDLAKCWKPLASNSNKDQINALVLSSMEVANALDALRQVCSGMPDEYEVIEANYFQNNAKDDQVTDYVIMKQSPISKAERQTLFETIGIAQDKARKAIIELNEIPVDNNSISKEDLYETQKYISECLGRVNAAAGSLLALHTDNSKSDIPAEQTKLTVIGELLPEIAKGLKKLAQKENPEDRDRHLGEARQFCETALELCDYVKQDDLQKMNDCAIRFGENTFKILQTVNLVTADVNEKKAINISTKIDGELNDLMKILRGIKIDIPNDKAIEDITAAQKKYADAAEKIRLHSNFPFEQNQRDSMFKAIQDLESSLDGLEASCAPLGNDARTQNLRSRVKALRDLLGRLRETTSALAAPLAGPGAEAAAAMRAARESLERGSTHPPVSKSTESALEADAIKKLAHAGAAAGSLLTAYSDAKHPDVASAKQALRSLAELVPIVIEDVKKCSAGCTPDERNRRKQQAGALCDAADALCRAAGSGDLEKMSASSLSFGDASSDLLYSLNREAKPETANQIIQTSKALAGDTSDLLLCASDLTNVTADPAVANSIDESGSRCADAAGKLLTCAKLTSPFLHEPEARDCMFKAIQDLERSLDGLEASCGPLGNDARTQNLRSRVKALRDLLGRLRETTSALAAPLAGPGAEAAAAMRAARESLERGLTHPPVAKLTQSALEADVIKKLAHTGAAAGSLLTAYSDAKHPDVTSAKQALHSLAELVPAVIENVKKCSAGCTPDERNRRKQQAGALCDAADALCRAAGSGDLEKLSASSLSFGDASSDLLYSLNREAKSETANQIIHTSKTLAGDASDLLLCASDLTNATADPAVASSIDESGSRCADAAGKLLTCAKLTSPFLHEPEARDCMFKAIQDLERSLDGLEASCAPLGNDARTQNLRSRAKALRDLLGRLRETTSALAAPLAGPGAEAAAAMRAARESLERGSTHPPVSKSTESALEADAIKKLAHTGAAAGSLLTAYSDAKHPDVASAKQALHSLAELVPAVIENVKKCSAGCTPDERNRRKQQAGALCDAADALCRAAGSGDLEKLSASSLSFGDASSDLLYSLNREAKSETANQIIHTSKTLAGDASDLLLCASDLTNATADPAVASSIDESGSRCADAAGKLLTCAKLTSPFLHEPEARDCMFKAIQDLERSLDGLEASCAPLGNDARTQNLRSRVKALRDLLGRLRETTSALAAPLAGPGAEAAAAMRAARESLERGSTHPPVSKSTESALEADAIKKLAHTGAAAGSLLTAYSDAKHPDVASAKQALHSLAELVPAVIENVKKCSAGCTPDERNRRKQQAGALCDAADALCRAAGSGDLEKLSASSLSFGDASSDLLYSLNREAKSETANQIIHTSKTLAGDASDLLLCASDLTNATADPAVASSIDESGSRCADAAGKLLTCAKLTSPFLHEPESRDCMFKAIQDLERSLDGLEASCAPLGNDARTQNLRSRAKALRDLLGRLRETTSALAAPLAGPGAEAAAAMRAARESLERGSTHPPVSKSTESALEADAIKKLAHTGAAAGSLLTAYSDAKHPDVASAKQALHSLAELVPAVIENVKKCSAGCTPDERNRRKQQAGALCDAADALCRAAGSGDLEKLSASSLSFGDASSDLLYSLNREAKSETANQIIHTSKTLAGDASDLLLCASDLTNATADPAVASSIDESGSRCADAAGKLLTCAKLTSPFLHEPEARDCMFKAIQDLERSLDGLEASCAPFGNDARTQNLRSRVKALRDLLGRLRETTSALAAPLAGPGAEAAAAMRAARESLERGSTHPPVSKSTESALEADAIKKLAHTGAAAGSLLTAYSDAKHPDVASAKQALHSLAELVPAVIENVKKCSAGCTPDERNRRKQQAGALCDAADALCRAAGSGDLEKLSASSLSFGDASSDLLYSLNREAKSETANQIIHTSKTLAGDASDLLLCASDLTNATADPAVASSIDESGSRCADAAGKLLTCAKLTSPFLHEPEARDCMFKAIQDLERSLDGLEASCAPLGNDTRTQNLRSRVKALRDLLGRLRETTSALAAPLAGPGAEAAAAMRAARESLKRGSTHPPVSKSTESALEADAIKKLAHTGAAAGSLLKAYSDAKHPDVASAKQALHSLAELVPAVIENVKKCSAGCTPDERNRRKQQAGALCDAADALCRAAGSGDLEKLSASSLSFGDASSDLLYSLNREAKSETANQIIHTSKTLADDASDLLLCASDLTNATADPAVASSIDESGSRCADAAGKLLTCAKLTSPFLHEPEARDCMFKAIQDLERSLDGLEASCAPLGNDARTQNLRSRVKALRDLLGRLRETTSALAAPLAGPGAEAAAAMCAARESLERGSTHPPVSKSIESALEADAIKKLAHTGAAAGSLLTAYSDAKHPDVASAKQALHSLAELVPAVIENVKKCSAGCTPDERNRRKQQAGALCDAADALCRAAGSGDLEKLSASSLSFGDASSDLLYSLNREAKSETANQIIHTSKTLAGDASDLLLCASDLTNATADPAVASSIDESGSRCADAAGKLLTCAKLTSPFLHEPEARDCMFKAIQDLERSLDGLEASCAPFGNDARTQNLRSRVKALRDLLGRLRETTSALAAPLAGPGAEAAAAMRAARESLERGSTHPPVAKSTQSALEADVIKKLAHTGAAAGSLLTAYSDAKHPDVASAKQALHSLAELVPTVIEDVKKCSAGCTPDERNRRKQQAGALCDAADALCRAAGSGDLEKLNTKALLLGDASSDLYYTLHPGVKHEIANQIIHTTKCLAGDASDLLSCASDLRNATADPSIADSIDETGSLCGDSVTRLVTLANMLSPTLSYPENQKIMTNSINNLSSALNDLINNVNDGLRVTPDYPKRSAILENGRKVAASLSELKKKMQEHLTVNESILPDASIENANKINVALEILNQKITGDTRGNDDNQEVLADNILTANAAVMYLLNCYADCTEINEKKIVAAYEEIAKAMNSVSAEAYNAAKCASSLDKRNIILDSAHELCEASKQLYQYSSIKDVQKMNEAAIQYSTASSSMLNSIATDVDSSSAREFFARAQTLTERMSELLADASEMAPLDQTFATRIDDVGSKCADSTRGMLSCAHISATAITNETIRDAMKASTDNVKESLSALHKVIETLVANNQIKAQVNNLSEELVSLQDYSDHLIRYVPELTKKRKIARKQTLKELEGIVQHVEDIQKNVQSILNPDNINILKESVHNFKEQYDRFEDQVTLAEKIGDCCISTKANLDAMTNAYGKLLSNCDPLVKKELEEKYQDILKGVPKILDSIRDTDGNKLPLKKINRVDIALENYEKQLDEANQLLSRKLKTSLEYGGLKRATYNLADDCYRLRNLIKKANRNRNVADLKDMSCALVNLGDDLEDIFSTEEDSHPLLEKVSRSELHELESDLMFQLVAFNKNQMAGSSELVIILRKYVHELSVLRTNTNLNLNNGLLVIVKRIILLIILLIWYLIRYYITSVPIDEGDRINFVKSILKEIEKASDTASQTQITSNKTVRVTYETLLFPPRDVAICTSNQGELIEKMAIEANRLAASLPIAAMSAGADAKKMEAANLAATQFAALCVQIPQNNNSETQYTIEEAIQEVNYSAFKLLRMGEVIVQDPESAISKWSLWDASRELHEKTNKMVRLGNPKEQLLQLCNELASGMQIQQLLAASPMHPVSKDSIRECLEALQQQRAIFDKVMSDKSTLSRDKFSQSLISVNDAVRKNTEKAAQAAYLLSIAGQHENIVEDGLPEIRELQKLIEDGKQACILHIENEKRNKIELKKGNINNSMNSINVATSEACKKIKDDSLRAQIEAVSRDITSVTISLPKLFRSLTILSALMRDPKLTPVCGQPEPQLKEKQDALVKIMKDQNSKFLAFLLKEIKNPKTIKLTVLKWQDYDSYKKDLLDVSDALIKILGDHVNSKNNKEADYGDEMNSKDYLQKQINLATKWLQAPCYDIKTKNMGMVSVRNLIEQADKISEGLKNEDKEELQQLRGEARALFDLCSQKHDNEKSRQLIDKLHELKKTIEETVISRVVEDFIHDEEIVTEFTVLVENASVEDKTYRFKLENSIAALLEHLGRVTSTARIVAVGGSRDKNVTQQLLKHTSQAELLAPKLVQAAKAKLDSPAEHVVMEEFTKDSTEYSQTIDKIRDLCDQSVDPLDFVRTAGEMIQKMCEEMSQHEPLKASVITRLANRVVQVGASESAKTKDEELAKALNEARTRLKAVATSPHTRKSQIPDWRTTTVEILRTANEVESALNGETIFKKQINPDQPIFIAAHNLHAAIREWSARDNELVAVAKKMAVQMARLSEFMITDRKQALIDTTKSIVQLSAEATRLARKLAMECTDVNLRNNLLQVSERIPTVGGQLKMLSTVKSMRFNYQGSDENREAMTMLVENAQNLMQTIEEVVKAAAGASVKIRSERGSGRLRWVRKPMYYS